MGKALQLSMHGYSIEELPNLAVRPWASYRHLDGRVVRLPADAFALNYYRGKGLVVVTDEPLKDDIGEVPKPIPKPRKKARRKTKQGGKT